jgi:hypothetical protein
MSGEVTKHISDVYRKDGKVDILKLLGDADPYKTLHLSAMKYRNEEVFGNIITFPSVYRALTDLLFEQLDESSQEDLIISLFNHEKISI